MVAAPPGAAPPRAWKLRGVRSASAAIVEEVLAALFRGDMAPGNLLGTEQKLADDFGVSRLPVRDALRTLAALGAVEIRVGKDGGAFIARPGPDLLVQAMAVQFRLMEVDIDAILEAQIVLESRLAALAACNRAEDDLVRMAALLDRLAEAGDGAEAVRLGMAFHEAVAGAAGNPVLALQLRALLLILERHHAPTASPERTARILASHRRLLDLIRRGDATAAAAHVAAHVERTRRSG